MTARLQSTESCEKLMKTKGVDLDLDLVSCLSQWSSYEELTEQSYSIS